MITFRTGSPGLGMSLQMIINRPDVASEIASVSDSIKASPLVALIGLAVGLRSARFIKRLLPITRRSASRLSFSYLRALSSGKRPRGLKFRKRS